MFYCLTRTYLFFFLFGKTKLYIEKSSLLDFIENIVYKYLYYIRMIINFILVLFLYHIDLDWKSNQMVLRKMK